MFMDHNHGAMVMGKAFLRLSKRGAMRWVSHNVGGLAKHLHQFTKTLTLQHRSLSALIEVKGHHGDVISLNLPALNMMTYAMQRQTVQQDPQKHAGNKGTKKTQDAKATTTDPQVTTGHAKPMLVIARGDIGGNANSICWGMKAPNRFSQLTRIPAAGFASFHSVCATEGGFVVTGGEGSVMCSMFTAATTSWQGMRKLRSVRCHHASICIRGVLRVLGGVRSLEPTATVECMELADNHWQDGPHLPTPVTWPKVTELSGRLFLLDAGNRCLYELDETSSVWRERIRMPGCRIDVSVTSVKGKLAMVGGCDRVCTLYDPTTDAWTQCEQPRHQHYFGTLVSYGDRVLLMGGRDGDDGSDAVESFNLDDGTWSAADLEMPANNLYDHHALVLTIPHSC